jgi:hypothetical protein
MLRKSISCMLAGLLIALPAWLFIYSAETHWMPGHGVVKIAAITMAIAGIIWLFDEVFAG